MLSITMFLVMATREEMYYIDPENGYIVVHSVLNMDRRTKVIRFYPYGFDTTDVIYVNTKNAKWTDCKSPDGVPGKCLTLTSERLYTLLEKRVDTIQLQKIDDSTYTFSNIIGSFDRPYKKIFLFFLMPRDYRPLKYSSDQEGTWTIVDSNMIKFTAYNVKKATISMTIRKRPSAKPTSLALQKPEVPLPAEIVEDTPFVHWYVNLKPKVYFKLGSYYLTKEAKETIRDLYNQIDFDKIDKLIIVGHTDNLPFRKGAREPISSNWELSAMRAAKVARYLIQLGAPPEKIVIKGHAYTKPDAPNDTPEGRAKNRRVEFMVKLKGE